MSTAAATVRSIRCWSPAKCEAGSRDLPAAAEAPKRKNREVKNVQVVSADHFQIARVNFFSADLVTPACRLESEGDRLWESAQGTRVTRYDPMPAIKTMTAVQALPKSNDCTQPSDGWPVVIYSPGVVRNCSVMCTTAGLTATLSPSPLR